MWQLWRVVFVKESGIHGSSIEDHHLLLSTRTRKVPHRQASTSRDVCAQACAFPDFSTFNRRVMKRSRGSSMAVVLWWVCVSCYKDLSYLRASGQTTRHPMQAGFLLVHSPSVNTVYTHQISYFNPQRSIYTHFHLNTIHIKECLLPTSVIPPHLEGSSTLPH